MALAGNIWYGACLTAAIFKSGTSNSVEERSESFSRVPVVLETIARIPHRLLRTQPPPSPNVPLALDYAPQLANSPLPLPARQPRPPLSPVADSFYPQRVLPTLNNHHQNNDISTNTDLFMQINLRHNVGNTLADQTGSNFLPLTTLSNDHNEGQYVHPVTKCS